MYKEPCQYAVQWALTSYSLLEIKKYKHFPAPLTDKTMFVLKVSTCILRTRLCVQYTVNAFIFPLYDA